MSIMIHIYYTGVNGAAKKFAEEMMKTGVVEAIRKEKGNEGYAYFSSFEDPETILLIDRWKDQEALDVHHASSMMETIIALREKYDLHMRVERYLLDDVGVPSSDHKFIRK